MLECDRDIYASAPLRRLLGDQMREMATDLQRCFGTHGLLVSASIEDVPPALPMLGCWTRLWMRGGCYDGDVRALAAESLPFVDDAFDLILLRHAHEIVPATSAWLLDAVRVLAPGGLLVLTGVHPLSGWAPWFCWRTRAMQRSLWMPLQLSHVLQHAGMEIERVQRVGRLWPSAVAAGATRTGLLGGGYVLIARKRRRLVTPLRIKSLPRSVPASSRLAPGTRRHSAW